MQAPASSAAAAATQEDLQEPLLQTEPVRPQVIYDTTYGSRYHVRRDCTGLGAAFFLFFEPSQTSCCTRGKPQHKRETTNDLTRLGVRHPNLVLHTMQNTKNNGVLQALGLYATSGH